MEWFLVYGRRKPYHILETIPYSGRRLPYPRGPAVAQLFSRWSALAVLTAIQPAGVLFSVNSHAVFYAWMCYSCLDMEAHALSRYKQTGQVGCHCWMRKMSSLLGWFNSEILSAYSTQCEQNKHRSYHTDKLCCPKHLFHVLLLSPCLLFLFIVLHLMHRLYCSVETEQCYIQVRIWSSFSCVHETVASYISDKSLSSTIFEIH